MGWNPGTTQELFSLEELVRDFSLDNVHKKGAQFNHDKTKWFNHQYLIRKTDEQIATMFMGVLQQHGLEPDLQFVQDVVFLVKDRVNFVQELWAQTSFFFIAPAVYDEQVVSKRWKPETGTIIRELMERIKRMKDFTSETFHEEVHTFMEERQVNPGNVMNCLRLSLVGGSFGPDLPLIAGMLGKEEVLSRLANAVEKLG